MRIDYRIVALVLAAVVVYDEVQLVRNVKRNRKLAEFAKNLDELTSLYAKKLNDHEVPMDEFEFIIMNNLIN